jgi:Tfp pilus assembly protein PilF/ADP-heptose:LPS heptosyltransferase
VQSQQKKQQALFLMHQNRLPEAKLLLAEICRQDPRDAQSWLHLARVSGMLNDLETAEQCCHKLKALSPGFAGSYMILGNIQQARGEYQRAIANYNKALKLNPDDASVYNNLANVLTFQKKYDEAVKCFKRALRLDPNNINALFNMGVLLVRQGRYAEAGTFYNRVLGLQPQNADAHWDFSCLLLLLGDHERGWQEYAWRWQSKEFKPRNFPFPEWGGDPLGGKRIFVYAEQGIGDEIMFSSCIPDLMQQTDNVIIECDPRLAPIYARSFPAALVCGKSQHDDPAWVNELGKIDKQVAIGSLPRLLRKEFGSYPKLHQYLKPDPAKQEKWQQRLAEMGGSLKVGISWRGGKHVQSRAARSITLEQWLPILQIPDVRYVNLQYGDCTNDMASLAKKWPGKIAAWDDLDQFHDLDDLAALIAELDLIISVDNATVHLAAGLGKPVWVFLPFTPDWRWQLVGDSSYWYPGVRLIRQEFNGDWSPVVAYAANELKNFLKGHMGAGV